MVVIVSDAVRNSRPQTAALFWRAIGDLGGQREHDVELTDREQVDRPLGESRAGGHTSTPRAVLVAARGACDPSAPAVCADFDMPSRDGGAALFDGQHDLELVEARGSGMHHSVCRACGAEDAGDLN